MNIDQILSAISVGETSDWEFKSAKGGFPGSFWETYSAMANTDGGTVVLGIKEKDSKFNIEGLSADQLHSYQKNLWDNLNNRSKVSRNILSSAHVQINTVGKKNLLVIQIPFANRLDRPIYLGLNPFINTFRRYSEGDYRCTDDQVRRMLADASTIPSDHRILKGFKFDDLDPLSLEQYRQRFSANKPNHPWNAFPLQQFLEMFGGWRRDRETEEEGITLAALLMFGKYRSILDALPSYFVDYREKVDPDVRWNHRIYPDGTWESNLFQFYQRIWPHLSADLKVPFKLEGIHRIDETPVHKALREALVNALIHSDYTAPGGVVVERYQDRFTLENPGTLLVSLEQLRRGGTSECRNKALQNIFMMIGGGEKAGSGIHRIQSEWRNQHWRAPGFTTEKQPDRIRLVLPMVSLIPQITLASLEKRLGHKFKNLKHLEVVALTTADIEGEVSNARLQDLETDHPVEITHVLQDLCLKGMLISDNRRRWTRYRIPDSSHLTPNSSHLTPNSSHLTPNSSHLTPNSSHLTPSEIQDLERIASSIANKKHASASEVQKVIRLLCMIRPLEASLLATLLKRAQNNLRSRFLSKMVVEGLLELQYPDAPNRPDQAYIAKDPTT